MDSDPESAVMISNSNIALQLSIQAVERSNLCRLCLCIQYRNDKTFWAIRLPLSFPYSTLSQLDIASQMAVDYCMSQGVLGTSFYRVWDKY